MGTIVVGLGNPLMGDDGIGLAALERLRETRHVSDAVELVDGGTWGMNLLPLIEDAERIIFLDAIDAGLPPGTLVVLERDELPRYFAHKLSPHQIDLREVLALAELRDTLPRDVVAIGIQPALIELRTDLSPLAWDALDSAVAAAAARLQAWGLPAPAREIVHA